MSRMKLRRHNILTYLLFGLAMALLIAGTIGGESKNEGEADKLLNDLQVAGQANGQVTELIRTEVLDEDKEDVPQLLRFHVLANSDEKEDQQLKNEIKDVLVQLLKDKLRDVDTLEEAEKVIAAEMSNIVTLTENEVAARGFAYQVTGEIGIFSFPTRMYGDALYPAGNYRTVRIIIGEGKGENWWCVLFPALCFVEGARVVAEPAYKHLATDGPDKEPEDTKKESALDNDSNLQEQQQVNVIKFKFKIIEYVSALFR